MQEEPGWPDLALPGMRSTGWRSRAALGLAALQNAAGNFVRPAEVFLRNITEVFGSDLSLPASTASAAWANVSLASSAPLTCLDPFKSCSQSKCAAEVARRSCWGECCFAQDFCMRRFVLQ